MADLNSSVNQLNANVAFITVKFQDFENHLDIIEVTMAEIEKQSISDHREKRIGVFSKNTETSKCTNGQR